MFIQFILNHILEILSFLSSGVVAIATIQYVRISKQLFQVSDDTYDITRYTVMMNCIQLLEREKEKQQFTNESMSRALSKMQIIIVKYFNKSILLKKNLKDDENYQAYQKELKNAFLEEGIDINDSNISDLF